PTYLPVHLTTPGSCTTAPPAPNNIIQRIGGLRLREIYLEQTGEGKSLKQSLRELTWW
ncbi:unnamed protein product, partial [Sphagnum troendelagicum]